MRRKIFKILSIFCIFLFVFFTLFPHEEVKVKITALDTNQEESLSTGIAIYQVRSDQITLNGNQISNVWNINNENLLYWNNYENIENTEIMFIVPAGTKQSISFVSNRWSGICQIEYGEVKDIIDLYSDSDYSHYNYLLKSEFDFQKFGKTFLLSFIITAFIKIFFSIILRIRCLFRERINRKNEVNGAFLKFIQSNFDNIFIIIITFIAFFVRIKMFNINNYDMEIISSWLNVLKFQGINGLKTMSADYPHGYRLVLLILSYFDFNSQYLIKTVSMFFDFFTAILCYKFVKEYNDSKFHGFLIYAVLLFVPTIMLNSSFWGQCDSIYTFFIVLMFYRLFSEDYVDALIFLGVGLTFKMQAIFALPVLIYIYISKKKFPFYYFFIIPSIYLISSIPSLLVGSNLKDALSLFFYYGSNASAALTAGFNNIYSFVLTQNVEIYNALYQLGVCFTIALIGILFFYSYYKLKIEKVHDFIELYLVIILIITCFLPGMHERYLYSADVLSILWLFLIQDKKKAYAPFIIITHSCISYIRYISNIWPGAEYNILTELNLLSSLFYPFFVFYFTYIFIKRHKNIKIDIK